MGSDQDYFTRRSESFAIWDQATSSWKTSEPSLIEVSIEFSERWPTSGTTVNGTAYEQPPLVRPIGGKEYSLLPTAGANDWKGSAKLGQRESQLDEWAENLPDWVKCPCCDDYACIHHFPLHAWECSCSAIDERDSESCSTDPYTEATFGRLTPDVSEWLMGFQIGHTDLDVSETQ